MPQEQQLSGERRASPRQRALACALARKHKPARRRPLRGERRRGRRAPISFFGVNIYLVQYLVQQQRRWSTVHGRAAVAPQAPCRASSGVQPSAESVALKEAREHARDLISGVLVHRVSRARQQHRLVAALH